jgi:hypothetical protein
MIEEKKEEIYPISNQYEVGMPVKLKFSEATIHGYIRCVIFTNAKVRFSVFLEKDETTLHNIDSNFVEPDSSREKIEFETDNYS